MNGTLNYNTLLQLMLFLRREKKWDEVMYADIFFTLRQHPEWQEESGINLAPSDPPVLAVEKDQNKHNGKTLKRCCSACSVGRRCLKLTREEMEEDLEMLVAPGLRTLRREEVEGQEERSEEGKGNCVIEGTRRTPVAGRTRSSQPALQALL